MTSAAHSIPGPETITRRVLSNGAIALARENFSARSVIIAGYVQAGSIDEPADKAGLAAFTAVMLSRGTAHRTFTEINETVEGIGASVSVRGGVHLTTFSAKCLAEDLPLISEILADILQNPSFPAHEVEKVRGEFVTGLQQRDDNTRARADLAFRTLIYPENHPYSRASEGYVETIRNITREDLIDFYEQFYRPHGMIIAIVGAVEREAALAQLERTLGAWRLKAPRPAQTLPPVPRLTGVQTKVVLMPGKFQSDLILGYPGIPRNHPDYYPAALANMILGVIGMYGRLGDNVRDTQGLAYYVYSRLDAGLGPGPWAAAAGVNPQNVDRAVSGILDEIRRLRDTEVEPGELSDAKTQSIGSLPLRLETNEGVAHALLDMELYDLGLDYLQRYPSLIEAVNAEQIQEVARKYLDPESYALAVAGPEKQGNG